MGIRLRLPQLGPERGVVHGDILVLELRKNIPERDLARASAHDCCCTTEALLQAASQARTV